MAQHRDVPGNLSGREGLKISISTMSKKKNRKSKTATPMAKPLEHLLETGDTETYGQLCWSLGNRDTVRHQAGDEIALGEWEESGKTTEASFRLTEETVENINRCLGMRTCGEAAAMFTPPPEPVEPQGECPHGHQEAAWDHIMYGIRPTKPCPQCGDIPIFTGGAMSLGFMSNEPVKGIDGNKYTACPECGDDMLELHGDDPVGWGWTIACTNCEWEIKQAEELDIAQYSDLMEEIKLKVEAIQRVMEMPGIINQTRVETACLQLRMVLELIVFSSLVSNKDAWQKSQDELRRAWNIKKIMGDLQGIQSRYYPEPKGQGGDFLTEERLVTVYDQLNKIIHAENPLGAQVNLRHYMESMPKWLEWTKNLLIEHKVFLYYHPNVFYWVRMFGGPEDDVLCTPVRTRPSGEELCPWPDCLEEGNRQYCEYIEGPWRECQLQELEPAQTEGKKFAETLD